MPKKVVQNSIKETQPNPTKTKSSVIVRDDNVPIVAGSEASESTKRRYIELSNGVSALLISWNGCSGQQCYMNSSSSFVCVSLNIGRLHDPPKCGGLAELCQRLTLSGSQKYPKDDGTCLMMALLNSSSSGSSSSSKSNYNEEFVGVEQHQRMQSNSMLTFSFGNDQDSHIAVTDDQTIYAFCVSSSHQVNEILDRLGAGLQVPLLSKSTIERELKIWLSERKMTMAALVDKLDRVSGDSKHSFNQSELDTGRTIEKRKIDELEVCVKEFHAKNYSANLLRVVVSCDMDLNAMEALVIESFGGMQNLSLPRIRYDGHPYGGSDVAVKIRIKSKPLGGIHIIFALPDQSSKYEASPDLFLTILLHSEEIGGLQSCLHRFGLGHCQCRLLFRGNLGFDSFCISVAGLSRVHDAENRAITAVFRYLAMLRSEGIQELQRMGFAKTYELVADPFRLRGDYGLPMEGLPMRMQRYPLKHLLTARFLITQCQSEVLLDFVRKLTLDRCRIFVSDSKAEESGEQCHSPAERSSRSSRSKGSKWDDGIQFNVEKMSPEFVAACSANWPSRNEFDADFCPIPIGSNLTGLRANIQGTSTWTWTIPPEFSTVQPTLSTLVSKRWSDIEAPKSEERSARCCALELKNGAQVFLLERESLEDKAYICISLGVGRLHDPSDCRGLAQLCQRLTLQESEKFSTPENCFENLMSTSCHQGSVFCTMNVSDDHTAYHFEIDNKRVFEGLDRLGSGILKPKFLESSISRERKMSQHRTKISALDCLQRSSGNPTHPYNDLIKANQGTVGSIALTDLRRLLVEFHGRFYSANRLRIAFSSDSKLEDMEKMVIYAFGEMPNLSVQHMQCYTHPFEGSKMGVKVRSKGLSLGGALHIVFPLSDQSALYKASPDLYVSHLLNSEDRGTLNACRDQLKLGSISAELQNCGSLGFDSYWIRVFLPNLTGLSKADMIATENNAITAVFRYLALLRHLKLQEWLYNMIRFAQRKRFTFDRESDGMVSGSEKLDLLQGFCDQPLSVHLQRYPINELLTARCTMAVYSPKDIAAFLDQLIPSKCKIFVSDFGVSDDHECSLLTPNGSLCCSANGLNNDLYTVEVLTLELLAAGSANWPNASNKIDNLIGPPRKNAYICTDYQLKPREPKFETSGPQQLLLKPQPGSCISAARLWFCQDGLQSFKSPHAYIAMDLFTSPGPAVTDCKSSVMMDFMVQLLDDHLGDLRELANSADLSLEVSRSANGIQVCCSGYSQPLSLLMSHAATKMRELTITENSFNSARSAVLSILQMCEDIGVPDANEYLTVILMPPASLQWLHRNKMSAAKAITYHDIMKFADEYFGRIFLRLQQNQPQTGGQQRSTSRRLLAEFLVYGNASSAEAVATTKSILANMPVDQSSPKSEEEPISSSQFESSKSLPVQLPPGSHHLLRLSSSTSTGSTSSCIIAFQILTPPTMTADEKTRRDFLLELLVHILRECIQPNDIPECDKVQLELMLDYFGGIFVLDAMSTSLHPIEMEDRMETYIGNIEKILNSKSAKSVNCQAIWENHLKLSSYQSISHQGSSYWRAIKRSAYGFGWNILPASTSETSESFEKAVKAGLLELWRTWIKVGSSERRKMSVHRESKLKLDDAKYASYCAKFPAKLIKNPIEFRQTLPQCSAVSEEFLNRVVEV